MSTPPAAQRGELWRMLLSLRTEFATVALLSAVANLLMLTPTLYMLQVYDRVLSSQNQLTLAAVSLIALLLLGAMALAEWVRARLLVLAGMRLDEGLGTRVFNASFDARMADSAAPRRNPSRAFADLLQLRQFLTGSAVFGFFDLPRVPVYIAVMFLLHPWLGWLSIAFALLQAVLAWWGHHRALAPAEAAQQAQAEVQQFVQDKVRNTEVLESMGMVANLKTQWAGLYADAARQNTAAQGAAHRLAAISKFVRYLQQSLALGAGALLVIDGQLSPGAMIAANVLMTRALAPIDMLVGSWRGFITARAAFGRLAALLQQHPQRDAALSRVPPTGALTLREVSATAPGRSTPILQRINLQLPAGQVLVVLGPSGSGKSTLARVLLGIWGEVQGDVLLDERPLQAWERDELGPHLGYLPQDIEVFDASVAENIARLGEVVSEDVIAAARATGLHEMILHLPRGYDTPIGEGGSVLSGGQRQRLALARAMYRWPRLVVLDEPNANLDSSGDAALARTVQQLRQRGCSVVLVTHRPEAVALADRLLLLHQGRVQAHGPRDAVLAALSAAGKPSAVPAPSPLLLPETT
jgi:ATP-binding cassette subfamily C exporter for protease/lipase